MEVKNFTELKNNLMASEELRQKLESNPMLFLSNIKEKSPMQNKRVFLTVVYMVGAALLISIVLAACMVFTTKEGEVDDFFVMIASAAIGALAGLLVPNPSE